MPKLLSPSQAFFVRVGLLVHLAVTVGSQQALLHQLLVPPRLLQAEVAAAAPADTATEPGGSTKSQAENAAHSQVRVLNKGDAHIEEDLLKARDSKLGLDLGRRGDDLVNGLQDRCPRQKNVVTSDGSVPVSAVLSI